MSVNVRVKQKSLFKKKVSLDEVIELTGLSYGICDENYRLVQNEKAERTIIYNENKLARGIEVCVEGTDILLSLSLPTSREEIRCFYDVITKLCEKFKTKTYIREEECVSLEENEVFIKADEEGSIGALEDLQEKIGGDVYSLFQVFGVYNPISLGQKEIEEIKGNLDYFGDFLNKIQSLDVYYAAPRVYKVNDRLVGIYAIGAGISSVVPTEPYIIFNQIEGISDWYVMLKDGQTVKYDDFINHISNKEYYDKNHVITNLDEKEIEALLDKYGVEI